MRLALIERFGILIIGYWKLNIFSQQITCMEATKDIKSVADFISSVFEKIAKFKEENEDDLRFWFRGEGSVNFKTPLVPSSYRVLAESLGERDLFFSKNIKQIENNTDAEFMRKSVPYIKSKGIENTGWNRYFLMQHYKINTRLLDWTEDCLLALFFALIDYTNDDARVWILKPFELNNCTVQTIFNWDKNFKKIPSGGDWKKPQSLRNEKGEIRVDELTLRYLRMGFNSIDGEDILNVYYPLAIYPTYFDERMAAQKACFTIFGNKINGLLSFSENHGKFLDFVVIPKERKHSILNELKLLGVDFTSIYPDLDGLGTSINHKFKSKFNDDSESIFHLYKNFSGEVVTDDEESN